MPEPKDIWSKLKTVAKILTPLVVFALGTYYAYRQQLRDAEEKRFDRHVNLGKSLSSGNPLEQKIAMAMLRVEKEKHPAEVPDELLAIAIPQLISLAATDPNADIAEQAKKTALDLSRDTKYLEPVRNSVERAPALIYFHIRDERQREDARSIVGQLQDKLGTSDFIVRGIQMVNRGPSKAEVRYFRQSEKEEAGGIDSVLASVGLKARLQYVQGYENSTSIRLRHYEVWYGPVMQ